MPPDPTPHVSPSGDDPPEIQEKIPPVARQIRADLISFYFAQGKSVPQILRLLERDHQISGLSRELPYHDLAYATSANWLTYSPPPHSRWPKELKKRYPFLLEAHVPSDGERMAVVTESARLIARSINHISEKLAEEYGAKWDFREYPSPQSILRRRSLYPESGEAHPPDDALPGDPDDPDPLPLVIEIRIGVSGGRTMGATIMELGRVLAMGVQNEVRSLADQERWLKDTVWKSIPEPKISENGRIKDQRIWRRFRVELRLLFINLVSGFDTDPFNHPIAYLTAMINSHEMLESRAQMMCFCANPFVRIGETDDAASMPESPARVKRFVEQYGLDIIVTSAGSIEDTHTSLSMYYGEREDARQVFLKHQVQGDFLWMPLKSKGPFHYEDELSEDEIQLLKYRPMTLLNLEEVAEHVRRKHDVVLMIAPCARCHEPKHQVLAASLNQERPVVTHLVSDRWSVARLSGRE